MTGCTHPDATNYNPDATEDNQTCEFTISGRNFIDYGDLIDTSFTLSYSIRGKGWVFFHDYLPDFYVHTREELWTIKNKRVYKHNSGPRGVYYTESPKPVFAGVFSRRRN